MKDMFRKVSAFAVLVGLFGFVACSPAPSSSSAASSSSVASSSSAAALSGAVIKIVVKDNTTNTGNNVVYIVGDLAGLPIVGTTNNMATWDPTSPNGQMTSEGNGLWSITLSNTLTNNVSFSFKFANGTATFGSTWDNQEQQVATNGSWEDKDNRSLDVLVTNVPQEFYLTNLVVSSNGNAATDYLNAIANWKGTGSTAVVDIDVHVILKGVANTASPAVASGTNVEMWGGWNSWGGAVTNAAVDANGDVTFTFHYKGAVSVGYQLRTPDPVSYFSDPSTNNFSISIPETQTTDYYVTNNAGVWHN